MKVCKYCFKEFDVNSKVFANHVRWCVENRTNGDKGSSKLSKIGKERYRILRGRDKEFEVNCYRCKKEIKVIEPEFKFPMKEKYFCDNKCMFGGRINAFPKDSDDHKKKTGERTKELWKDPKYVEKMINNNTLRNKRFSSIGELEIKNTFKKTTQMMIGHQEDR